MNTSAQDAIGYLGKAVAFDSVSARSNLDMISWIESVLASAGFNLQRIASPKGDKAGLVARLGPQADGGLVLSTHTDVVPVEEEAWSSDPFTLTRRGNRLIGRGAADMKGFLSCALAAAHNSSSAKRARPLTLVFSYDEEVGCTGIREMMPELLPLLGKPQLCVVGEPTELTPALGHKGKVTYEITCHGTAGHSALAPEYCNALHIAADAVSIIRRKQEALRTNGRRDADYAIPYSTLHVGALNGGGPVNLVPHLARVLFEFRHLPDDDPGQMVKAITTELSTLIAQQQDPAASADFKLVNSYPGFQIAPSHAAVDLVHRTTGAARTFKVDYGTEAGFFAAQGISTVVCGPGSMAQGHQPDEYIEEEQMAQACVWLDRLIAATA